MTKEEAKMMAELYSALAEGKTIQVKMSNYIWEDVNINLLNTIYDCNKYRIKPESKYRPYTSVEEFIKASKIHGPYIKGPNFDIMGCYHIPNGVHRGGVIWTTYENLRSNWEELSHYEWQDGTPCGIFEK